MASAARVGLGRRAALHAVRTAPQVLSGSRAGSFRGRVAPLERWQGRRAALAALLDYEAGAAALLPRSARVFGPAVSPLGAFARAAPPALLAREEPRRGAGAGLWGAAAASLLLLAPTEADCAPQCCCQVKNEAGEWEDCGQPSVRKWEVNGYGGACRWHLTFAAGCKLSKAAVCLPGFGEGWERCLELGAFRIPEPREWFCPGRTIKSADGPRAKVRWADGKVNEAATRRKCVDYQRPHIAALHAKARADGLAALGASAAGAGAPLQHPLVEQAAFLRVAAKAREGAFEVWRRSLPALTRAASQPD